MILTIQQKLQQIFSSEQLLQDADSLQYYGKDRTTIYTPNPLAVVFPRTTEQVQQLVQLAREFHCGLVPSAGRTGYSGGAVAAFGEIVVSCERLNQIKNFNAADRIVACEAGVITAQLQKFAQEQGLYYPVDFASSGSSCIGGNIATNAGGIKVFRYGSTRHWVAGLTVVTGQGEILHLNKGLMKNATGYDLLQLFIGSEGTLGIITAADMRLTRLPDNLTVMLVAVNDVTTLLTVLQRFQQALDLTAFEFFAESALQIVMQKYGWQRPLKAAQFYAVIEFENPGNLFETKILAVFQRCLEQNKVVDGVLSQNLTQAQQFWRYRESISEAIYEYKPHKYDLSVLISHLPEFMTAIEKLLSQKYPQIKAIWFGHIGDGNLHLNLLKPAAMSVAEFQEFCQPLDEKIFALIQQYGGAISAEHGIGLIKKDYLSYSRTPAEITLMRRIKQIFDPGHILNPHKIFT